MPLIFSFGWMNAVALVVIIVGGMIIELLLIHIHDSRVWKQIIGHYFRDFDECYFEPAKIELKGLTKVRDVLHYPLEMSPPPFLIRFLMPSIRAFHVYPKPPSRILPSAPKAYQMAGGTSCVFLPSKTKNSLRLMSVAAAHGLVNEGRNLIIVALVGADLHIRIFDASGKKVVDKAENELVSGETLTALKTQLNLVSDESGLSEADKQNIIADATSIAGHTQISVTRFQLLHEIGHAFVTNHIISKQGWFAVVYFYLLFVFVAFHREAGILALLVAFALAACGRIISYSRAIRMSDLNLQPTPSP